MKRKNIDAMREVRLWIGQVVVPGVMLATSTMAIPEVRKVVATKATQIKDSIGKKLKKD